MSQHLGRIAAAISVLFVASACDAPPPTGTPAPASRSASVSPATATYPWMDIVDGETGPGAAYRLYMPSAWNGNLVVYAHGIVAPFLPVTLPAEGDAIASIFGQQGYAVALSSYTQTGLAVKDGVQRTHQLRGIFASKFGKPKRTYLSGSSMGGFIVTKLAETYPKQYDGVLPMCGVVGGFPSELEYVFTARLLFDHYYPGVLPGTLQSVPMSSDPATAQGQIAAIQGAAVGAILTDERPVPGSVLIALVDQSRMPLPGTMPGPVTAEQFGAFVVTPLLLHAIFVNDIVSLTQGHFPFSNVGTVYTSTGVPWMAPFLLDLNTNLPRVDGGRDAIEWMSHNGDTSGELTLPMLTLHTRYDTWVPRVTESIYANKVAAAGHSDLLVQRTTEGWDHCTFAPAEIAQGMADLAAWVEHGVKPAP